MTGNHADDPKWMRVALNLARRGVGQTAPNPSVGCVIIKNGIVLGRGWTQPGGRPHAETMALEQAGKAAEGAEVYVTLEPCAHTGQTPPCAEALVRANVGRVVIAVEDPDNRVSGKGIEALKAAAIETVVGVLEKEAASINRGFFLAKNSGRPLFTLKTAATIDGKIALANGDSKWITGAGARRYGHMLRAQHDAILVGVGTVLADDPSLNCRIAGLDGRNPVRVILDSSQRTLPDAKAVRGDQKSLLVTGMAGTQGKYGENVDIIVANPHEPVDVAKQLAERGITSVLIEGGSAVAASFLEAGLIDCIEAFSTGKIIGNNGLCAVGELNLAMLANAPHFTLKAVRRLGPDMLASYEKAE